MKTTADRFSGDSPAPLSPLTTHKHPPPLTYLPLSLQQVAVTTSGDGGASFSAVTTNTEGQRKCGWFTSGWVGLVMVDKAVVDTDGGGDLRPSENGGWRW
ncbi:hypothetical protein Hanom_Chr02g00153871 [Helianthus anomalus]